MYLEISLCCSNVVAMYLFIASYRPTEMNDFVGPRVVSSIIERLESVDMTHRLNCFKLESQAAGLISNI